MLGYVCGTLLMPVHMLRASVHCTDVNLCKGTLNLKRLHRRLKPQLNAGIIEGLGAYGTPYSATYLARSR